MGSRASQLLIPPTASGSTTTSPILEYPSMSPPLLLNTFHELVRSNHRSFLLNRDVSGGGMRWQGGRFHHFLGRGSSPCLHMPGLGISLGLVTTHPFQNFYHAVTLTAKIFSVAASLLHTPHPPTLWRRQNIQWVWV